MTDHYNPVGIGLNYSEALQGDIAVLRTPTGVPVMLPLAVRRLRGHGLEVAGEIQGIAAEISRLQGLLGQAVEHGRDSGLSWGVIGWSVGTTSEAARQRWA